MSNITTNSQFAILATDIVVFRLENNQLKVLLVQAKSPQFAGKWALPGGLVALNEDLDAAASRFLKTFMPKTPHHLEQLYSFGNPQRDPSGRVVSVAYLALVSDGNLTLTTTTDYPVAAWFPVCDLPDLAYDHSQIIAVASDRLRNKLKYTNLIFTLLPDYFTLTQLQLSYQSIWGTVLDKRNFRKKILSSKLVRPVKRRQVGEAHRPAQLYAPISRKVRIIDFL